MRAQKRANSAIFLSCVFLWSTLAASCRGGRSGANEPTGALPTGSKTRVDEVLVQLKDAPPGLHVRLSHGKPGMERGGDRVKVPPAAKIPEADAERLLKRLSPLVAEKSDKADFALREKSLPPPQTGNVIKGQFPPPRPGKKPPAANVAGTELKVVRFAPEGEVPVAPHLAITFNQPMIAITSHADTVAKGVPVVLTPTPKGKWRWIGAKTLLFDPDVRFPAATEYTVEVPQGTRSASGAILKKGVKFKFATPAPTVTQMWPQHGPQKRDVLMFAAFDQKIDRNAVIATIALKHGGSSTPVRLATPEEIAKDTVIKSLVDGEIKAEHQGRYLAFKPESLLPGDSNIEVAIGPGTPSAEGPRKTKVSQSYNFRTFGPLRVVEWHCSWGSSQCPPGTPWTIRFTNPLDAEKFDPDALEIEPKLPGMKAVVSGDWLSIHGRSKGRTTYKVTIPASISDQFEQTLGKPQTLTFRVTDAHPQLFGPTGLTLRDPAAKKPSYDLHSINIPSLDVEIYKVDVSDWRGFLAFMEKNPRKPVPPPGKKVFDRTIKVAGSPDEMIETHIDLAPALNASKHGHAVVIVKPTRWPDRYKPELNVWVQSTDIALDAFSDSSELIAWATNLGGEIGRAHV